MKDKLIAFICTACKETFFKTEGSLDRSTTCNYCMRKDTLTKEPTPAQLDREEMEFIFREDQRNDFLSMGDM